MKFDHYNYNYRSDCFEPHQLNRTLFKPQSVHARQEKGSPVAVCQSHYAPRQFVICNDISNKQGGARRAFFHPERGGGREGEGEKRKREGRGEKGERQRERESGRGRGKR